MGLELSIRQCGMEIYGGGHQEGETYLYRNKIEKKCWDDGQCIRVESFYYDKKLYYTIKFSDLNSIKFNFVVSDAEKKNTLEYCVYLNNFY